MLNINIAEDWIQTADHWYHILTALPTEPQPLPVGVDLFLPICLSVTKSLKNAKTLFAKNWFPLLPDPTFLSSKVLTKLFNVFWQSSLKITEFFFVFKNRFWQTWQTNIVSDQIESWKSVDAVLGSNKEFVITNAQTHSPGFGTADQCSKSSGNTTSP